MAAFVFGIVRYCHLTNGASPQILARFRATNILSLLCYSGQEKKKATLLSGTLHAALEFFTPKLFFVNLSSWVGTISVPYIFIGAIHEKRRKQ